MLANAQSSWLRLLALATALSCGCGVQASEAPRLSLAMSPTEYPAESLASNEEGTVTIELTIGPDGAVTEVRLEKSSGHPLLDDAGLIAARATKLSTPPMRNGVPTTARILTDVVWKLPLTSPDEYFAESIPGGDAFGPEDMVTLPEQADKRQVRQQGDRWNQNAMKTGKSGRMIVFALIGADGRVLDTRLAASSGFPALDDAGLEFVRGIKYLPGQINGRPAALWGVHYLSVQGFDVSRLHNCYAKPGFSIRDRRQPAKSGDVRPPYKRWTLVNAEGAIEDSLLLTDSGWRRLDPTLVAAMNMNAKKFPINGRPATCWIDGTDPLAVP